MAIETPAQPIAAEHSTESVAQQPAAPTPAGLSSPSRKVHGDTPKVAKKVIGKKRTADEAAAEAAPVAEATAHLDAAPLAHHHEDAPAPKRKCTEVKPFSFMTDKRAHRPMNHKSERRASETRGFAGVPRVEKKQPTKFVPFSRMERAVADYSARQQSIAQKRFELGL
eukprot:NODE_1620_length_791_cov_73.822289_g1571_i0.p1 GENE.NODE_1620_length_791_cov_73.822289_g1571_i0~~NODE_1620_length_791_cov_73.822289_g1571_i0.p1  ORF type:complete len:168 (-),score=45.22 NODE_1620_length_791_cov_73.822289_g1571_i0:158-661(-)